MEFEKHYQGDDVAVIYSPGFGAGWSTWNYGEYGDALVFDKELVEHILNPNFQKLDEIASRKYPEAYRGGLEDATICWVLKGSRFIIDEYDGSESVKVLGPDTGYLA